MTDVTPDQQDRIFLNGEMETFLKSTFGKYLMNRAELDKIEAEEALVEVDPTNLKEIIRLQSDARRFKDLKRWIQEVATAGELAYQDYKNQHNDAED